MKFQLTGAAMEEVDSAGMFQWQGPFTEIMLHGAKETVRENAKATTKEVIMGSLEALGEVAMDLVYSVGLVGTGILILARVVGYTPANKYIGLLPLSYVLLRYLFGGAA